MSDLHIDVSSNTGVVNLTTPVLVAYWTEHFGVTEALLKEAIATVGNSVEKVEAYINTVISYYMHIYAI